ELGAYAALVGGTGREGGAGLVAEGVVGVPRDDAQRTVLGDDAAGAVVVVAGGQRADGGAGAVAHVVVGGGHDGTFAVGRREQVSHLVVGVGDAARVVGAVAARLLGAVAEGVDLERGAVADAVERAHHAVQLVVGESADLHAHTRCLDGVVAGVAR